MIRALLIGLCLLLAVDARAADLKIATWNLNWLTTRQQGDPGLPPDVKVRSEEDFNLLRRYALELDADVIAVEEVDGREAAAKVFPSDRYSIHMTRDRVTQRTGLIVRRGMHYDSNPDVIAIAGEPGSRLRSGADITLRLPSGSLRLLAVHLKQGCQSEPLSRSNRRSCLTLRDQVAPLKAWIADRQAEQMPFLVLGDFNRWMDGRDQFLAALRDAAPLDRATEGRSSPCWGAEAFIDHILAGGPARAWMRPDSLRVLRYRETGLEWKERLSDHCPVSVRLAVPGAGE
jgi:endonuclease/exonuclease/phosphatase family metal-dependent hydrolase